MIAGNKLIFVDKIEKEDKRKRPYTIKVYTQESRGWNYSKGPRPRKNKSRPS